MRGTLEGFTYGGDRVLVVLCTGADEYVNIELRQRAFDRLFNILGNGIYGATFEVEGGNLIHVDEERD